MNYKYRKISLDVTSGLTDYEIEINGDFIFYIDGAQDVEVKIDDISNDLIPLESKGFLRTKFKRLFLTVAASAETLSFIVSNGMGVGGQSVSVKDGEISSINGVSLTGLDLSSIISTINDNLLIQKNNIERANGYILNAVEGITTGVHSMHTTITDVCQVPTGKTWYLKQLKLIYADLLTGAALSYFYHTDSSDTNIKQLSTHLYKIGITNNLYQFDDRMVVFNPPLKMNAGDKIRTNSSVILAITQHVLVYYNEVTN